MLANLIRKLVSAGAAPAPLSIVRVEPVAKPAPKPPKPPEKVRPQLMRFLG